MDAYSTDHVYDVIIVGAGLSGVNAAYRIQTQLPHTDYTILEGRSCIGGTWDLFRYPGIRSDSSLWTFGFPWRPWTEAKGVADGSSILDYIRTSAREFGIDKRVQYDSKVRQISWSSEDHLWTVLTETRSYEPSKSPDRDEGKSENREYHARFVFFTTGYYDYDVPLQSAIPGIERFKGTVVHPQFWPAQDAHISTEPSFTGKRIVIIGSGATAVTLLPNLVKHAAHVTLLQRSPSYVAASPALDPLSTKLRKWFPPWLAFRLLRIRSLLMGTYFSLYCTWYPQKARALLRQATSKRLPDRIPQNPHFEPKYNPWEQRLCFCPDGDFFDALKDEKADIVTDTIQTVNENGILLTSGQYLDADWIVTATGLKMQACGGAKMVVDGKEVRVQDKTLWKGTLMQDVPNMGIAIGYPNASWTLGADVSAWVVSRVIKHMQRRDFASVTPRLGEEYKGMDLLPVLQLSSTYAVLGNKIMPKTGTRGPWRPRSFYLWDLWDVKWRSVTDGLEYKTCKSKES